MFNVQILGAAGCVTGSKYLLETDNSKIMLECGLFQGRKELRRRNWAKLDFDVSELDAVLLSHAHIDHSGYLPRLVRDGFRGPIYATAATIELLNLLLPDSAHLQQEEADYANKKGYSKHAKAKPLYDIKDAQQTLKLLKVIPRGETVKAAGFEVTAQNAGHILGSSSLHIRAANKSLLFSGDIGRYDVPILQSPQGNELGDLVLCEATYGGRLHGERSWSEGLAEAVKKIASSGGTMVVPSFAVGRTQFLLYELARLEREGEIPILPVFVDSPMAVDATHIYRDYKFDYDDEASKLVGDGERPLTTEELKLCRSREESMRLNDFAGPHIIISASGMVTGGRILHHMRRLLPKEDTVVVFAGFQAYGSRGRVIQSGAKDVKIFGERIPINAEIVTLSGLSAHGDQQELLRWLDSCSGSAGEFRIVHAESDQANIFCEKLEDEYGKTAAVAQMGEKIEL